MPNGECTPVLVLASGRGTRMGGPKALMAVAGRPWWMIQCERLAGAGAAPVWVVSPPVRAAMLGTIVSSSQCPPRFVDGDPGAPMFESIRRGVEFLALSRPRGVFVLPVDVPAPERGTWNALRQGVDGNVTVPACGARRGHPIYMPWAFAQTLIGAPASARLDELIAGCSRSIEVSDPAVTTNLNTPDGVRAWEAAQLAAAP